jgi:hypothetical protein
MESASYDEYSQLIKLLAHATKPYIFSLSHAVSCAKAILATEPMQKAFDQKVHISSYHGSVLQELCLLWDHAQRFAQADVQHLGSPMVGGVNRTPLEQFRRQIQLTHEQLVMHTS